jgi:hypothetical protein
MKTFERVSSRIVLASTGILGADWVECGALVVGPEGGLEGV